MRHPPYSDDASPSLYGTIWPLRLVCPCRWRSAAGARSPPARVGTRCATRSSVRSMSARAAHASVMTRLRHYSMVLAALSAFWTSLRRV